MTKIRLWMFLLVLLLTVLVGSASAELTDKEKLGKNIFFDKISDPDSMSCADCHAPQVGFTGPIAGINLKGSVYRGAVPQRFGNRKPPSAAYATLSPNLYTEPGDEPGEVLFIGGNFWDGRATGEVLGNPAADQAMGPFLNPVEQNNFDKKAVLEQIAASKYVWLWELVWGEPISYGDTDEINESYNRTALAIAAYESSSEVNQFSSKYDANLTRGDELTEEEAWGLELFNAPNNNDGIKQVGEGGNCAACHPSNPENGEPPLFTDFTFDNLGIPRNPDNPFYDMDTVFVDGEAINPEGMDWVDPGLGGFLATRPEWSTYAADNMGKHKVPTLRNVAQQPGKVFPKAYGHNGYFKSLESIVHFYNTRDLLDTCPDPFTTEKDALKMNCWPLPEVTENVNTEELGNLSLTSEEEAAIVAFLKTLSDGYYVP
ncbi:cytochrome-c peroxidase [Methanosarcina sp. KYL-1]|uniref:cytochrome-c peroxidase n=1 Tax=Methanosarcina sp. KYL-1 TaxID=2602068 RepID=UPI002100901D|nr:cytochrome c peroxidase [Methanosarcina sp. KYL-1]